MVNFGLLTFAIIINAIQHSYFFKNLLWVNHLLHLILSFARNLCLKCIVLPILNLSSFFWLVTSTLTFYFESNLNSFNNISLMTWDWQVNENENTRKHFILTESRWIHLKFWIMLCIEELVTFILISIYLRIIKRLKTWLCFKPKNLLATLKLTPSREEYLKTNVEN